MRVLSSSMNFNNYSLSFGKMSKSKFQDIDLCCVNQFKAPIEKFNTQDDFNNWVREQINILLKDEKLQTPDTPMNPVVKDKPQRIKEWVDALYGSNSKYFDKPACALLILTSVFKDLKYDHDTIPSTYNEEIVDITVSEMKKQLELNPKRQFDFDKLYRQNLAKKYITEEKRRQGLPSDYAKPFWIKIDSRGASPSEFEENIQKLKAMSSPLWCTSKEHKAKSVIEEGNFYICAKGDEAKIGMRTIYDGVFDVQGRLNDFNIPFKYSQIVDDKIQELNMPISKDSPFPPHRSLARHASQLWRDIPDAIKEKDYLKIMEYLGLEPIVLEDGTISLKEFSGYPTSLDYFKKYGINERDFVEKIKIVRGNARFHSDGLKDTVNLEEVGGNLDFYGSSIVSLNRVKRVGGNLNLYDSKIEQLGELEEIGGGLTVGDAPLKDFGNLKRVKGVVAIGNNLIPFIPQLEEAGNMDFLQQRYESLM